MFLILDALAHAATPSARARSRAPGSGAPSAHAVTLRTTGQEICWHREVVADGRTAIVDDCRPLGMPVETGGPSVNDDGALAVEDVLADEPTPTQTPPPVAPPAPALPPAAATPTAPPPTAPSNSGLCGTGGPSGVLGLLIALATLGRRTAPPHR